jgi:hypothetical protein
MRRRPEEDEVVPGALPDHLRVFHPDRWADGVREDQVWCENAVERAQSRMLAARRQWSSAGRAWCAEHGGDWHPLIRGTATEVAVPERRSG